VRGDTPRTAIYGAVGIEINSCSAVVVGVAVVVFAATPDITTEIEFNELSERIAT
jgi:hypothetical protein